MASALAWSRSTRRQSDEARVEYRMFRKRRFVGKLTDAAGAMGELGETIRTRRRALGLSQRQLASRAGLSVAAVR